MNNRQPIFCLIWKELSQIGLFCHTYTNRKLVHQWCHLQVWKIRISIIPQYSFHEFPLPMWGRYIIYWMINNIISYPEDYHLWSSDLWSFALFKRAPRMWGEYDSYFEGYLLAEIRMYWPYEDHRIIKVYKRNKFSVFWSHVMKIMSCC